MSDAVDDISGRLTIQAAQLIRAQKQAAMGGGGLRVCVADPEALIWTLVVAQERVGAISAENGRMREALDSVLACWRPRPTMDGKDYGHFDQTALREIVPTIRAALAPAQKGEA